MPKTRSGAGILLPELGPPKPRGRAKNKNATERKFDEEAAKKKFNINRELRIVLTRCKVEERPSSAMTLEPPVLEVSSIPLVSPTSTIASRPPKLRKQVPIGSSSPDYPVEPSQPDSGKPPSRKRRRGTVRKNVKRKPTGASSRILPNSDDGIDGDIEDSEDQQVQEWGTNRALAEGGDNGKIGSDETSQLVARRLTQQEQVKVISGSGSISPSYLPPPPAPSQSSEGSPSTSHPSGRRKVIKTKTSTRRKAARADASALENAENNRGDDPQGLDGQQERGVNGTQIHVQQEDRGAVFIDAERIDEGGNDQLQSSHIKGGEIEVISVQDDVGDQEHSKSAEQQRLPSQEISSQVSRHQQISSTVPPPVIQEEATVPEIVAESLPETASSAPPSQHINSTPINGLRKLSKNVAAILPNARKSQSQPTILGNKQPGLNGSLKHFSSLPFHVIRTPIPEDDEEEVEDELIAYNVNSIAGDPFHGDLDKSVELFDVDFEKVHDEIPKEPPLPVPSTSKSAHVQPPTPITRVTPPPVTAVPSPTPPPPSTNSAPAPPMTLVPPSSPTVSSLPELNPSSTSSSTSVPNPARSLLPTASHQQDKLEQSGTENVIIAEECDGGVGEEDELFDFKAHIDTAKSLFESAPMVMPKTMWYCCVLWDSKILKELLYHEKTGMNLHSTFAIAKQMSETLQAEGHSWPGVSQMDWMRPFVILDITTDVFSKCGVHKCLRVQEKIGTDTPSIHNAKTPVVWDLVIFPECEHLALEMVRLFRSGVKTSVVLWGARKDVYPIPWENVKGELFLSPTLSETRALSVLIFHHETLSKERCRLISGAFPTSELWEGLQDPSFGYRTFMQMDMELNNGSSHLSVHVKKMYTTAEEPPSSRRPLSPITFINTEDEFEESILEECSDFDSADDEIFSVGPGEDWGELYSVSQRASMAGSSSSGSDQLMGYIPTEITKFAEKLFQRPARNSQDSESALARENGNGLTPRRRDTLNFSQIPMINGDGARDSQPLNDSQDNMEEDEPIVYNGNGGCEISDSQKQLLLTQEMVISDSEDEQDRGTSSQQKDAGKDLEENVLTSGDRTDTVSKSATEMPPPPPTNQNGYIQWGSGKVQSKTNENGTATSASNKPKINGQREKRRGTSKNKKIPT